MKCSWCGENVGKGHKAELCRKYNKPESERFNKMENIEDLLEDAVLNTEIIKTLQLAKEAILVGSCRLLPSQNKALVEINQMLDRLLGKENEHK